MMNCRSRRRGIELKIIYTILVFFSASSCIFDKQLPGSPVHNGMSTGSAPASPTVPVPTAGPASQTPTPSPTGNVGGSSGTVTAPTPEPFPTSSVGGNSGAAPIMVPGAGFNALTPEPPSVGSAGAPGYDARAIARWDTVPYQTIRGQLHVGVIAFHVNGISRVEFSIDGGRWVSVSQMSRNPSTGVVEYVAVVDAANFSSKREAELRAVVYPKTGKPRVLADGSSSRNDAGDGSLLLEVDPSGKPSQVSFVSTSGSDSVGNGTKDKPYATLQRAISALSRLDDATIYLGEGDYKTPDGASEDNTRWFTITSAPGVDPARVRITGPTNGARWDTRRIHFSNLSIVPAASTHGLVLQSTKPNRLVWFDAVTIDGGDREVATNPAVNGADTYWTDVTIREYTNPVDTANGSVMLARHVHEHGVLEDSFSINKLLVDSTVDDVNKRGTSRHPDIVQYGSEEHPPNNFIIYGLRATNARSQGIYINGSDWALVNILVEQPPGSDYLWQIDDGITDHVLLWNITVAGQTLMWRNGAATSRARNVSVRDSCFQEMKFGPSSQGNPTDINYLLARMIIDNNHFVDGASYGTRATTGNAGFVDAANDDFHPGRGSPLSGRIGVPLVPGDLDQRAIPGEGKGAIGAFQSSVT